MRRKPNFSFRIKFAEFLLIIYILPDLLFAFKPVASVAVARRGGTSTTFDVLNKYATISSRIVIGST